MSKYLVSIKAEDGTVEKILFNNYKEISEKTGLSVGTITRMMNGVTKYHKKDTKNKLMKYKIKKLAKTNSIDDNNDSNEGIEREAENNKTLVGSHMNNVLIEVTKFNMINTSKMNEQTIQHLRKNLYAVFNTDNCTSFLEHNIHCSDNNDLNSTINDLILEANKKINGDTICILICNKKQVV